MYIKELLEIKSHLKELSQNLSELTNEQMWEILFKTLNILEKLSEDLHTQNIINFYSKITVLNQLKAIWESLDKIALRTCETLTSTDFDDVTQNVDKLIKSIEMCLNFIPNEITSSVKTPSLSSLQSSELNFSHLPSEIVAEIVAYALPNCKTIGELLRSIATLSKVNKQIYSLLWERDIEIKQKIKQIKETKGFEWKIIKELELIDSSFLLIFCQSPLYSDTSDLKHMLYLAASQRKYLILEKIISECKTRKNNGLLEDHHDLFNTCLSELFLRYYELHNKENKSGFEVDEFVYLTKFTSTILSSQTDMFDQNCLNELNISQKRFVLSQTRITCWPIQILKNIALNFLVDELNNTTNHAAEQQPGVLKPGFHIRANLLFKILQRLIDNKVICDANCMDFIDQLIASPNWSKYKDNNDQPCKSGCDILMNLSNMPTALKKMDRIQTMQALSIAMQAVHSTSTEFFANLLLSITEIELNQLTVILKEIDETKIAKPLVRAIETGNQQQILFFVRILFSILRNAPLMQKNQIITILNQADKSKMLIAINGALKEANPLMLEFLVNHFLTENPTLKDMEMLAESLKANCNISSNILQNMQYNLQFLMKLKALSPIDKSKAVSSLIFDFINFVKNKLNSDPQQLFKEWALAYQTNNTDFLDVLNTKRSAHNYFSVTYKEVFDSYCSEFNTLTSIVEATNDNLLAPAN